ncbi:MAG: hypothetical protein H6807_11870 [Planctomycetes bacterium]|nr:hypothetical protein [Planctomycetota bacterium]
MTTPGKPSVLKRLFRFLLVFLVLLVALVALAPTLFSGLIRDRIVAAANERLDGRLELAEFSFGWTSGLELGGVELHRTGAKDPALAIEEARASVDLMAALSGRYLIEDLALQGVTLRVRRDERGIDWTDVMKPGPKSGEEEGGGELPEFRIAGKLSGLRVIYEDEALGAPIELADLTIDFSSARDEAARAHLSGPEGLAAEVEATIFGAGRVLAADAIRASGKIAMSGADLARFARGLEQLVVIDGGRLALDQTFTWAGGALDLEGRVEVEGLAARQEANRIGLARAKIGNDLNYSASGTAGRFDLDLASLSISGLPRQQAPLELARVVLGLAMPAIGSYRVEAGTIEMPAGKVDLSGDLRPEGASGLQLGGELDVAEITKLFAGLPRIEGKLRLKGELARDGDQLRLRGSHRIADFAARELGAGVPDIRGETIGLDHDVLMVDGRYDLNLVALDSSFAKLRLEGLRYLAEGNRLENFGGKPSPVVGSLDLKRLDALAGDLLPVDLEGRADLVANVTSRSGKEALVLSLVADGLAMRGGPLGEEGLRPGRTRLDLDLDDLAQAAASPIRLSARSDLFDLTADCKLASDPSAAFGYTGPVRLAGKARLDQLLAPFFTAAQFGRTDLDLALGLGARGIDPIRLRVDDKALAVDGSGKLERVDGRENLSFAVASGRYQTAEGALVGLSGGDLRFARDLDDDGLDLDLKIARLQTRSAAAGATMVDAGALALRAKGRYDAVNQEAALQVSEFKAGGADLRGDLDWSEAGGLARLKLDGKIDWAALASRFLTLVDPAARGQGEGQVAVELSSRDGKLEHGTGRLALTVPSLFIEGCDLSALDLAAAINEGKGKIEKGEARLNGGTVALGGDIDLTLAEPQFGSRFSAKDVRLVKEWQPAIARVIPIFAGVGVEFAGVVDADADLRGQGATWDAISKVLNGSGGLSLRQGRVESSPILDVLGAALGFNPDLAINDLVTKFTVQNGGLHQDGLEIKTGVVDLRLGGTTFLDGRLDYELGLKPVAKEPARWQQFVALVAADGYLPLRLGGTVTSPSPKLPDPTELIRRSAEDALRKGLNDILDPKKKDPKTGEEEKPKNPLGGLIDVLGGKKDKKKD